MNKKKWLDPNVPLEILALKLCEETGEVSREITDRIWPDVQQVSKKRITAELEHVIFIASTMLDRIS